MCFKLQKYSVALFNYVLVIHFNYLCNNKSWLQNDFGCKAPLISLSDERQS